MAKSTKFSRNRRVLGKASRVTRKTSRPKTAAGLKKMPARKSFAAPRPSAGAPRAAAKRAAAKPSPYKPSASKPSIAKPAAAKLAKPVTPKPAAIKAATTKWVYAFGGGQAEGRSQMRDLLGGKGANLAEMANLGLPVPPGFTITTEVCSYFYTHDKAYPKALKSEVEAALLTVGKIAGGKTFGDADNPLLVSVRSGARASMPGMMDTVLNLGLNDVTVEALAK